MQDKRILTIQDISCVGQCSLTVALPIISACGIECAILPSAVLSTHTGGFTNFTFRDLTEDIPAIRKHWEDENIKFDAVYTGYLGSVKQMDYVSEIMKSLLNEGGLKIVDPAMADNGKLYTGFDMDFVKAMAGLCTKADIILPNITEAAFMTDSECILENHNEDYINDLIKKLSAFGNKKIVLKGIRFDNEKLGIAIYDNEKQSCKYYFNKRLDKSSHGTGDCFASAFCGTLAQGKSVYEAVKTAAEFVYKCIEYTMPDDTHWYGVKFEKALPMLINKFS